MPWQENRTVDLREEFVLRAKAPECSFLTLCEEFGISRKTGYKWMARFDKRGMDGLADMSRRPRRIKGSSGEAVTRLVELRDAHPRWGPKKMQALLLRELHRREVPSIRTIARIFDRLGIARIRRIRVRAVKTVREARRIEAGKPNATWTVDFKGWWKTKNGRRANPLTVRDSCSRFVLLLKLMDIGSTEKVQIEFTRLFQKYGLPDVIHVDNGAPFASTKSPFGLSRLSAWWTSLGIAPSFSRPGKPQDNGGHERMHADIAVDLQASPSATLPHQQRACDTWVKEFNYVRPHEALGFKTPAEIYRRSKRPYKHVVPPQYPAQCRVCIVRPSGTIRLNDHEMFVGSAFGGHKVGVEPVDKVFVKVHFYHLTLGLFDLANSPRLNRSKRPSIMTPLKKSKSVTAKRIKLSPAKTQRLSPAKKAAK